MTDSKQEPNQYKRLPGMKILPDETKPLLLFGSASQMSKAISHDLNLLEEEELGTSKIITGSLGKIIQVKLYQPIEEVRKALQRFAHPIRRKQIVDFSKIPDKEWNRLFDSPEQNKKEDI